MSAYGPAVVIRRLDEQPIPKDEHASLLATVVETAKAERTLDHDDKAVKPRIHEAESNKTTLAVLLFSSYLYGEMPDFVREDEDANWVDNGKAFATAIEAKSPGVYRVECYYVED